MSLLEVVILAGAVLVSCWAIYSVHLLAAMLSLWLSVFQDPTGADFSKLAGWPAKMRRVLMLTAVGLVLAACGGASDPAPSTTAVAAEAVVSTSEAPPVTTTTTPVTTATTAVTAAVPATTTAPVTTATTTTAASVTTTTIPGPSDDDRPLIEGLGADLSAQIWETVDIVEEIRGLEFDRLPSIIVLSPEEFTERVRSEVASELEDIEVDEALFKLLGLLSPDDDVAALYEELYGESVAGFYSSDDQEMVIPSSGEELSSVELLTLLHELVHAVTDQHFCMWRTSPLRREAVFLRR